MLKRNGRWRGKAAGPDSPTRRTTDWLRASDFHDVQGAQHLSGPPHSQGEYTGAAVFAPQERTWGKVEELGRLASEGGNYLRIDNGVHTRDLRVDAGDACPEEQLLVQVLAEEARSGHHNRAGLELARLG
jgi:hypothetical protein